MQIRDRIKEFWANEHAQVPAEHERRHAKRQAKRLAKIETAVPRNFDDAKDMLRFAIKFDDWGDPIAAHVVRKAYEFLRTYTPHEIPAE